MATTTRRKSHYEQTGKLGPKIDVFEVTATSPLALRYLHSTNWHRTCKEARDAVASDRKMKTGAFRAYIAS